MIQFQAKKNFVTLFVTFKIKLQKVTKNHAKVLFYSICVDLLGVKMLTDKEIKGLKPKADKKYLVADGEMLFVLVYPSGKKSFVFDYKDPKTR